MFISQHKNKFYYLYYTLPTGERKKFSTNTRSKREANQFLKNFKVQEVKKQSIRYTLSQYQQEYVNYTTPLLKPKSVIPIITSFKEFIKFVGDVSMDSISVRNIGRFMSHKITTTSVWSAKKYHATLSSAFNKAVSWDIIDTNHFLISKISIMRLTKNNELECIKIKRRLLFSSVSVQKLIERNGGTVERNDSVNIKENSEIV